MSYEDTQKMMKEEVWFLDSGCNNHMTGNKEWFAELEESFRRTVKLGNDTTMVVIAKGNIRMQINRITQVISDVYFIAELKNNLLSIGQLQEKGLAILIHDGTCKVFHSSRRLIMQSDMRGNRMFCLLAVMAPKDSMCLQTEVVSERETHLWHCLFGHLNHNGVISLSNKRMAVSLPALKFPKKICTTCLVTKQHRNSIPKKSLWRASRKLQLMHVDICGPIKPASNDSKRYILSFIDDFTCKAWVYFLHEKSETFAIFKSFKIYMEKESGEYITCFRTDRGDEFTSNEFEEFSKA